MIQFDRFKDGKKSIVTMSYDDGPVADRRLVEIFDKYGIRGTFHLNSGYLGRINKITKDEVVSLYKNHEVSTHTVNHPHLEKCPTTTVINEVINDRKNLENICGFPVRGMSYPFGTYNNDVINSLELCGIAYSRTIFSTKRFELPNNFLEWHPTCHHNDSLELLEKYINNLVHIYRIPLFYVWGHSYEFDNDNNWGMIEEFCKKIGGRDELWYATNIEIYDYIQAQKQLQISADNLIIYNPSFTTVWVSYNDETIEIKGGQTVYLDSLK